MVKPVHHAEFKKAAWGTQLYAGDEVKTSNTGAASILMSNNSLIELGPGSSMTIAEGPGGSHKKFKTISGVDSENLIDLSGLTMRGTSGGELVALAGLRAAGPEQLLVQLSPRNSKIRSLRPTFSWQSSVQVEKFKLKLFDKNGLLWTKETDETTLEYPQNERPLGHGETYFWQIEGLGLVESYQSASVGFSVLSEKDLAVVENHERNLNELFSDDRTTTSYDFLTGTLYQQQGLVEESIARFEAVAQRYPDAPTVYEVLGKLYSDIGLKDRAIAVLQKALRLSYGR